MKNFFEILKFTNRALTRKQRILPDFIIIGGARTGTTSLYAYLSAHPNVVPAIQKETVFFNYAYHTNQDWYRMYFPKLSEINNIKKHNKTDKIITGEATPSYLIDPHVPKRILSILPTVKLIILLRNPIERALSHYYHNVHFGIEKLTFDQAIKKESERINKSLEMLKNERINYSDGSLSYFFRMMRFKIKNYFKFSYLESGKYFQHIKNWIDVFPNDQLLIIKSEDFFKDTKNIFYDIQNFLGLSHFDLSNYMIHWQIKHPPMNNNLRKFLNEYYRPYNLKLYNLLDRNLDWA